MITGNINNCGTSAWNGQFPSLVNIELTPGSSWDAGVPGTIELS